MQILISRSGLVLNPGQMADLVLAWRQVAGLIASIPQGRKLADDAAYGFHLKPPASATMAKPAASGKPPAQAAQPKAKAKSAAAAKARPRPAAKPVRAKAKPAAAAKSAPASRAGAGAGAKAQTKPTPQAARRRASRGR
jgi:hypothetical protein